MVSEGLKCRKRWTIDPKYLCSEPMLRKLLTVLAILTGLAAINAPAQARISAVGGTGIERVEEGVHDRAGLIAVASAKVQIRSGAQRRESCQIGRAHV